jgi:FKBP-type peptidyl-prolyl cis-trans isomerase
MISPFFGGGQRSLLQVKVRYEGRLGSTGGRFDKGVIEFRLGMGEVIEGWDQGVLLGGLVVVMKMGTNGKKIMGIFMEYES